MYGGVIYLIYDFINKKLESNDLDSEYRKALLDVQKVLITSININNQKCLYDERED